MVARRRETPGMSKTRKVSAITRMVSWPPAEDTWPATFCRAPITVVGDTPLKASETWS